MPTRPISLDRKIHGSRRRRGPSSHADALYGLFYPPNHLRLVDFSGDPADITCGLLTFDRNLGPLPGEMNLWCGDKKGFGPELVSPRMVRARFNSPIYTSSAWSWDTTGGDFRGADGCLYALPASGLLQWAGGPHPAGKIWITGITRYDSTSLDYTFSTSVNTTGDASGFWCIDEFTSTQSGNSVMMIGSQTIRVYFMNNVAPAQGGAAQAGIVASFSGIVEAADFLSPITWRV